MQISLQPDQESFVQAQIQTGRYQTVDELFNQAIALLQKQQEYEYWLTDTRGKVQEGVDALRRGEGIEGDQAIAQLYDYLHRDRSA